MHTIEVTATDAARLKTVLSALKRGKWELEGEEVLAFAQAFGWAAQLSARIESALQASPLEIAPPTAAKSSRKRPGVASTLAPGDDA